MEVSDFDEAARSGNVARLHDETAERRGDALAIEMHGETISHRELKTYTDAIAGGYRDDLGLEEDDRILLYLPNCPQYLVAAFAAMKAGVVFSPVNPQYKWREITYQLEDTDAKAIVTHPALRDNVIETIDESDRDPTVVTVGEPDEVPDEDVSFRELAAAPAFVEREDHDVAVQPYTSGTTGRPKGVLLTHRNFRAQAYAGLESDLSADETRSLIWLPLYHITGFTHSAFQPLVRGGSLYLRNPTNWDADDAMATIEEHAISGFVGVTAMYVDMVNADTFGDHDLTSLETCAEGGAKMSVAIQERFEETAGVEMTEGYGLTETNGATHSGGNCTFGPKHGSVGQPIRMTDCKVVDESGEEVAPGEEGELLVRGPQVMAGYHEMPDATEAAFTERGYFRTGDVARRDDDNYYEIVDRKKHVIVTAGYNVYPSEVEELLFEHEAVEEAAVVGIPDERRNEVPKAFVVLQEGYEPDADVTPDDIKQWCLDNVAEYKHPREVAFIDELPRTTSGKIQKFKLTDDEE